MDSNFRWNIFNGWLVNWSNLEKTWKKPSRNRPTISQSVNRLIWGSPLFTWHLGGSHRWMVNISWKIPFLSTEGNWGGSFSGKRQIALDFFDRTKIPPLYRADSAARIWLGNFLSISGDAKGRSALYPPSIGLAPSLCPPSPWTGNHVAVGVERQEVDVRRDSRRFLP